MNAEFRTLTASDEPFLWEMLYQALYLPPGQPPFPREILQKPEIACYVQGWGQPHDRGFAALVKGEPVGAAWLRLLTAERPGYGYVDDDTPELSIAVLPKFRGRGIGSQLMTCLLELAQQTRYPAVCLSVSPGNPALRLYQRLGFAKVDETRSSIKMIRYFS
jgi:ribosomal protein S18 acetylase RimI-like enzyme